MGKILSTQHDHRQKIEYEVEYVVVIHMLFQMVEEKCIVNQPMKSFPSSKRSGDVSGRFDSTAIINGEDPFYATPRATKECEGKQLYDNSHDVSKVNEQMYLPINRLLNGDFSH